MYVYTGRAAGSHYTHSGGGGNYQCIVEDPDSFDFSPEASYILYRAEYEMYGNIPSSNFPLRDHHVPCSVCYVNTSREAVLMIPEKSILVHRTGVLWLPHGRILWSQVKVYI